MGPNTSTATASIAPRLLDNDEPGFAFEGNWLTSSFGVNYGANKRYSAKSTGAGSYATWNFSGVPEANYQIEFWANNNNYAADARYYVGDATTPALGNQQRVPDGWHVLGNHDIRSANPIIRLMDQWTGIGTFVVADAIRLTYAAEASEPMPPGSLWMIE